MSACAQFECNIIGIEPEILFEKICEVIDEESNLRTSIELTKRSNRQISYEYGYLEQSTLDNPTKCEMIKQLLAQNIQDSYEPYDRTISYAPYCSIKKWNVWLGYYLDDLEDFDSLTRVVELLLKYSEGELFYYRSEHGQGETEHSKAIDITLSKLKKYTPDMSNADTYRICLENV